MAHTAMSRGKQLDLELSEAQNGHIKADVELFVRPWALFGSKCRLKHNRSRQHDSGDLVYPPWGFDDGMFTMIDRCFESL